jgi:predicted Zn-dependent protease
MSKGFKGSEKLSMILPPSELGDMLMSSVGSAINGENVKYGRSMWKDSIGEPVASDCFSMVDDPTVSAPLSCVFDDEGVPAYRKPVIEDGVLKGFLRDSFCGDSTGNGMRRSSVEAQGAYDRTPSIKPLNLVIRPGNKSREDIIAQTDNGILVEKFAWPEADEMTGRFGLSIRCGYLIRKGEIVGIVNNALLMGNMLEAVSNVEAIGNDQTQMGVITVPTMGFSGMELVGN